MKILIINTVIDEQNGMTGVDAAITFELYSAYRCKSTRGCHLHITANHMWDKYTFIEEKDNYITTSDDIEGILKWKPFLGNCLILTHEQWLDKQNPNWRAEKRYQYW